MIAPSAFSASGVSSFLECAERYRREYLLVEKRAPHPAMALGSAFHEARRRNLEQKVWSGEDLPEEEALAIFESSWQEVISREGDEPVREWGDEEPEDYRLRGHRMVERYQREAAPRIHPLAVEEFFTVRLEGTPLILRGKIDVRTLDKLIIDTKTQKKGQGSPSGTWAIQRLFYVAAFPDHDFAWHVVSQATGECWMPEEHPELFVRTRAMTHEQAVRLLSDVHELIEHLILTRGIDQPWPGQGLTGAWTCKYCTFRQSCFWWA